MVNWDAPDIQRFKKEARTAQQEYCDLLGDREWDVIERWDWAIFRRKVGFGIYGPPSETPSSDNLNTGYKKEQLDVIEKICDQLVVNLGFKNRNIHFACIFVVVKVFDNRYTVPVFKAKRDVDSSSECVFVDTGARKYSNWEDYLSNNTLEKCIYCYPARGMYEENSDNEVRVKFGTSPACDLTSRIISIFDTVSTVVTISATGVGVAALCMVPIAGPIMAATAVAGVSTSAYGLTRSSYTLIDRAAHSQSIGLSDADARSCWLSIVGSSLGFAQGQMIASMTNAARAGEVMGKAGRIAFIVIQTGSLTVNGIGIVHGLAVLIDKSERNEITPLDLFQFSASLLFFTNAVVNLKTAGTIIKEVQHDVIQSHREGLSPEAKKLFNKQTGRLRGRQEMEGNAKVVKQLNRISNSKELYEMMARKDVDSHKVKLTTNGFKGMLEVNKNLKIHPIKLLKIEPEFRQIIFESNQKYIDGVLSREAFHTNMESLCNKYRINFESMRDETMKKLCQMYEKQNVRDITVGGKKIFSNVTSHEIDRLGVVLENTANSDKAIIAAATEFAKSRGCNSAKDFISYTEYFVADLTDTIKSHETKYQQELAAAKKQPGFKQVKFDDNYGIERGTRRTDFHREQALKQFNDSKAYDKLNERYNSLKSQVVPLNKLCEPGFFNDDAATYHYLKHKTFGKSGVLTPEEYFKIAEEVIGEPANKTNATMSQDGSCVMITYCESRRGVRAVKIDRQGEYGIATVMYDPKLIKRQ